MSRGSRALGLEFRGPSSWDSGLSFASFIVGARLSIIL